MENCKLEEKLKKSNEVESDFQLTSVFNDMCPIYMSYGMTFDEFWYGNSSLCRVYMEAYKLKQKALDEQLWLQGFYVYNALNCAAPVLHAFAKQGTKPLPYLKSPITQTQEYKEQKDEISEEEKQKQIENERLIAQVHFNALARMMNKRFENKEKGE